ncbi:MAG: segregation and condensation protein A [Rhodospirillaceae bacterium]|nr:MAG: segregation and condensation protein A [Rhodospirillaceae bacterium]
MREAGQRLIRRPQLGWDFFGRGEPESLAPSPCPVYRVTLYDLLKAYADHKRRTQVQTLRIVASELYSVEEALQRAYRHGRKRAGMDNVEPVPAAGFIRPAAVSFGSGDCFVAALELVRQGWLELRQEGGPFAPIHLRSLP